MTDFQGAVEKALYDRLAAQISDVPIFQHVPENQAPPVVIVGDVTYGNDAGKTGSLLLFEVAIVAIVQGPGRQPLNILQGRIRDALHDWRPVPTAQVTFGDVRIGASSSQEIQAPQGPVYFGQQSAILYAQDA